MPKMIVVENVTKSCVLLGIWSMNLLSQILLVYQNFQLQISSYMVVL